MNIRQFEIWLADLNPRLGTEPGKTRPVIIIQSDLLNDIHPSTLICPLSTQIRQDVDLLRVNLSKDVVGLNKDCAIMIDQVRAIDNKRLVKKLGLLPESLKEKLRENLRIVMDL